MKAKKIVVYGLSALTNGHAALYYGLKKRHFAEPVIIQEKFDRTPSESMLVNVRKVPSNFFLKFLFLFRLFKNADFIEVYLHKYGLRKEIDELMVFLLLKILKKGVVVNFTGRDIREWNKHSRLKKFLVRGFIKESKFYTIKESYMLSIIKENNIGEQSKHFFIHNGVHDEFFRYHRVISENKVVVLFNNRFKSHRHVDYLMESAEKVLKLNEEAFFIISGAKDLCEVNELKKTMQSWDESFKARVLILKLNSNSDFLYSQSDLFVMPADVVWLNNSILEAMRFGVIPILPDVSWSDKIIPTGFEDDLIYKHLDVDELSNRILNLIKNKEKRKALSVECQKHVSEYLSAEKRVLLHEFAYRLNGKMLSNLEYEYFDKYLRFSEEYKLISISCLKKGKMGE